MKGPSFDSIEDLFDLGNSLDFSFNGGAREALRPEDAHPGILSGPFDDAFPSNPLLKRGSRRDTSDTAVNKAQQLEEKLKSLESRNSFDLLISTSNTYTNFDLNISSNTVTSRQAIRNLRIFTNIDQINFFLKNDEFLHRPEEATCDCPIATALTRLTLKHRLIHRFPRKEQVYKRVINHCTKTILKEFKESHFATTKIHSRDLKIHMLRFYFGCDYERFVLRKACKTTNTVREFSNFSNLNFNQKTMELLASSQIFMEKVLEVAADLEEKSEQEQQRQLRKYLGEVEEWIALKSKNSISLEDNLASFFHHQNTAGKKCGVNLPWSTDEVVQAVRATTARLCLLRERRLQSS
jgi:hypothetical protein